MNLLIVLLILLILCGGGAWPSFGWHHYGYWPSGVVGVLVLLIVLRLLGII
jgi:hypothetical protein